MADAKSKRQRCVILVFLSDIPGLPKVLKKENDKNVRTGGVEPPRP